MITDRKLNVLLVDDESRILDGLRRQLRPLREEWTMHFVESGTAALEIMASAPIDVLVSDMRMPGMSGSELLRTVQQRWPGTLRIILSGQTDQVELLRDIGAIHQYLQKPCDPAEMQAAVRRAYGVKRCVESKDLQRMCAGIASLPLMIDTLQRLQKAMRDASPASEIAKIIEEDVGLSTKLLQLVNTSFFGLPRRVLSVKQAVTLLGTKSIAALAVTSSAFDAIGSGEQCYEKIRGLWVESVAIGLRAESLARTAQVPPEVAEAALLAGTLSLIGRSLLMRYSSAQLSRAVEIAANGERLYEAERQACGAAQHEVGGYALGLWAFSSDIVESVVFQANPEASSVSTLNHPLPFVHAARCQSVPSTYVEQIAPDTTFFSRVNFDSAWMTQVRRAA